MNERVSEIRARALVDGYRSLTLKDGTTSLALVQARADVLELLDLLDAQPQGGPRGEVGACEWEDNGNGFWLASCGDTYKVYPNDINVTGMHFCCFCGKPIKPIEFDPSSDGPRQPAATSSPAPAESERADRHPRKLTLPELSHLSALLEAERESGSYAGPREQYYARTERLIKWCNEQTGRK